MPPLQTHTWTDATADTSAAVLGYIHDNIPGALAWSNAMHRNHRRRRSLTDDGGQPTRRVRVASGLNPTSTISSLTRSYFENYMPPVRRRTVSSRRRRSPAMKKTYKRKAVKKTKKTYKKKTYKKKCVTSTQARTIAKAVVRGTLSKSTYIKQSAVWKFIANGKLPNTHNKQAVHEFTYMQPLELMDAVSTLYNNKTKSFNYLLVTGNFGDIKFDVQYTLYSEIRNNSNQYIELDIYWVTPRQDSDTGVYERWEFSMTTGNSEDKPTTLHTKPFDSNTQFSRYWKVLSANTYKLQPNELLQTGFKSPKMNVDWDKIPYGGTIPGYKKGMTRQMLIVQRNPILWDSQSGNPVGRPYQHYGGWIYEDRVEITCWAPEQAPAAYNRDKRLLLESYQVPDVSAMATNVKNVAPERVILDSLAEYNQ